MTDTITIVPCQNCKRYRQVEEIEYFQSTFMYGEVLYHKCITYLCSACGDKIDTMNTFNFNQVAAKVAYQERVKELTKL